jgi:fructokinase
MVPGLSKQPSGQEMGGGMVRIGIDLGGTKIEALALDDSGQELARHRVGTPQHDYEGTVEAMVALVHLLERETGTMGTVGAGIPGSLDRSTWLNGRPLRDDLGRALGREVRVENDANCLAVSEATDGAARGARLTFAVILGTGCGGGVAIDGRVHTGPNAVAGEWGHNPLPWAEASELPGPACYCGRHGCLEMWVSGSGIARDYLEIAGERLATREIAAQSEAGRPHAVAAMARFESRLARGLAQLVNTLDPDVIVFGGGVSRVERIYRELPALIRPYVFGGAFGTPLLPAAFGDSSGVRGAAWLWPSKPL